MNNFFFMAIFLIINLSQYLVGVEPEKTDAKSLPVQEEKIITTSHTMTIDDQTLDYVATVGTQMLKDEKGKDKGLIFYTSYTKDKGSDSNLNTRPIIFCFNGGPGSSSVWLHLGIFGPKRVHTNPDGLKIKFPFYLVENSYSMLDVADLVFIDPISTGYSRANEDPKQFHNVDADIESVAAFIRLYTTRYERWDSPKFVAGESYGTTRAIGVALDLFDQNYLHLNGIILISSTINYQTFMFGNGNDLVYSLFLPTYTATALFHHQLSNEKQNSPQETLKKAREFAYGELSQALMLGDSLEPEKRKSVINTYSELTGLSKEYIDHYDLRIDASHFSKELLRAKQRVIGRFDARYTGIDTNVNADVVDTDPSFDAVLGLFTATFNTYVRQELGWKSDEEYKILTNVFPWGYNTSMSRTMNMSDKLRELMSRQPSLSVYIAGGTYDLATPYLTADYAVSHLGLRPSLKKQIDMHVYDGGHMMYLKESSLKEMKQDLSKFVKQASK